MPNLFDSANYPTTEPTKLAVGDRWAWKRTDLGTDYAPASYSLKYVLRRHDTGAEIEITCSESGSDYLAEVASATTAVYAEGFYAWQAYIIRTSDSERVLVGQGTVELLANRDSVATDPRSHARKVLDAIEAVLESRASKDQEEYAIAGRSLKRTPIAELRALREAYKAEVDAEERKLNGAGSRKLLMRF
jgi:hypothetical protein